MIVVLVVVASSGSKIPFIRLLNVDEARCLFYMLSVFKSKGVLSSFSDFFVVVVLLLLIIIIILYFTASFIIIIIISIVSLSCQLLVHF